MTRRTVALALTAVVGLVAHLHAQDPFRAPDVLGPGQGVSNPSVVSEAMPEYTADALRARIQGVVEVEAVILQDGTVGDVRIHKSLDKVFGLDEAAIRAARAWRFKPATKDGKPVKFKAIIQLQFRDPFLAKDVFSPGAGITNPTVTFEAKPTYTQDALRAKVQGVVEVEAVVLTDGTVGEVRIHKSLDKVLGLDDEAIRAARAWRFTPAMKDGQPVKSKVIIQLEFRIGRLW